MFLIFNVSCISQKKATINPFEISGVSYFSWVVDENEKGTTIEVGLGSLVSEVQFDSIIFRKVMLPVTLSENKNGNHTVTAILPSGKSRIPVKTKHIDKPDQLIYHFNGIRRVQLLEDVERRNMIYYRQGKN